MTRRVGPESITRIAMWLGSAAMQCALSATATKGVIRVACQKSARDDFA